MLQVIRYPVRNPVLQTLIKYFWVLESNTSVSVRHKLLPVHNIDFIFNLSSPIEYTVGGKTIPISTDFHFNGIRNKYYCVQQTGRLRVVGAAFFPTGLFPVVKRPVSEFTHETIKLDSVISNFSDELLEKVATMPTNREIVTTVETALADLVDISSTPDQDVQSLFRAFSFSRDNIGDFCVHYGISQRKLERLFNKYIGASPKLFQRINRFNRIIRQLQMQKEGTLTACAYENDFFDQPHFVKEFKSFTGATPTEFLRQQNSIKQVLTIES